MDKKKFYVTTPIYYVTAKPHLGSLYSTLLADIASRFYKLKNYNTFFLTGTDEHGQKVAQEAEKANLDPKKFVDSFINDYKKIWKDYNIAYDYFIRTTDESHKKAVQAWLLNLKKSSDIYKGFYTGYYCTPCETYINEKNNICPSCSRETKYISEESYFFKLSNYQDRLLNFYKENPDFIIPKERSAEVISFIKGGLKDLSITRSTIKWGIEFPEDNKFVTYVWADALNNYITAVGYSDPKRKDEFDYLWPADLQIIGKDILIFHAVYWPAFLMACNLKLPKHILAHGWILLNKQKMSKSLSNTVSPEVLLDSYHPDEIRYYLARYMAITQDSEFSIEDLEKSINSDLVGSLGNLLNRMATLSEKNNIFKVSAFKDFSDKEKELKDLFYNILTDIENYMINGYYYLAIANVFKFIHQVNSYFQSSEPWKIKDKTELEKIISITCNSLYSIAILLWPVMPKKMEKILNFLSINLDFNLDLIQDLKDNIFNKSFNLNKSEILFKKIEKKIEDKLENLIENVNIQEFNKNIILVGTIISCQDIENSEKLYKLEVDFGNYGVKQILSGIKKQYSKEEIINKQSIFLFNLDPRKMLGFESSGMILIAKNKDKLVLVSPELKVENGTRLG